MGTEGEGRPTAERLLLQQSPPLGSQPRPQQGCRGHGPLTEQVAAGDASLCDGGLHGADGGREDVGLLQDLGQLRAVQGAEGRGVVLRRALVQLQRRELVAPGLGVPVLVLRREEGTPLRAHCWLGWKRNGHAEARPRSFPPAPELGFPGGSAGEESARNAGDLGSILRLGRSPREAKGYPLQYSGLENSIDCIVYEVGKSRTRLSDHHFQ